MSEARGIALQSSNPSGTVTFLFTDIEGSTHLWEHAADSMRRALERHDAILAIAVNDHHGVVFSTGGDGIAAAFPSADTGLAAAVAAQQALQREPWPDEAHLRIRMGLHTGEAHERGGDYFGPPVNRAARVMSVAGGGQILVSSTTAELLDDTVGTQLFDLGTHELKGIGAALRIFGVGAEGLDGADRPLALAAPRSSTNLPRPTSEWFGSTPELATRATDLAQRRLVSIVGPGGIGKTRLAIEMGHLAAGHFPDGVFFVELASVRDGTAVATTVAATLGVRALVGWSELDSIVEWLGNRRCLLIIDNCEHVAAEAALIISGVVQRCSATTVLATSRQRLGLEGERVVLVPALATDQIVGLFRDRALALDETVRFSPAELETIGTICHHLDSIPLAVELAAARVRMMSVDELNERLGHRFRVLRQSTPGVTARHQTLHATVDWSYQLLDNVERRLLDHLAVFARWFDLNDAEAIIDDADLDVLSTLPSLVEKSLVVADRTGRRSRFRLLETVREFAAERLAERHATPATTDRHMRYFLAVAEAAGATWRSSAQLDADAVFDTTWDDLRLALHAACAGGDLDAAERLLTATRDHAIARVRSEHGDWTTRTLGLDGRDGRHLTAATFGWAGWGALQRADHDLALEQTSRGIAVAHDDADAAVCLGVRGFVLWSTDREAEAAEPLDRVRAVLSRLDGWTELMVLRSLISVDAPRPVAARMAAIAEAIGSPSLIASARFYQGLAELTPPADAHAAARFYSEGIRRARSANAHLAECHCLQGLQSLLAGQQRPDATRVCRQALKRLYELGYWLHLWRVLATAARLLVRVGDVEAAGPIMGFLESNHLAWSDATTRKVRAATLGLIHDHPDGAALLTRGASLGRDAIVELALDALDRAEDL